MTEIRKLKKEDMDELFALLNDTFGHKYGRPMHFDLEQPKMWIRDDAHMEKHIAVFEDGKMVSVVGIYPLPTVIGGEEFLFCTTGNVATLPAYEGKGYFSRLFPLAIEEARRLGATAARLGGARQRYARYGFASCGPAMEFSVSEHNARHAAKDTQITLTEIAREDTEALAYAHSVMEKKTVYVKRGTEEGYRDTYLAMCSKESVPYLIKKNEKCIGHLSATADGTAVREFSLADEGEAFAVIAEVARRAKGGTTRVCVPPTMPRALFALQAQAQEMGIVLPSRFCIFEYERLVNRLLQLKESLTPLPDCDLVLQIEGGERLLLHTGADGAYCKATAAAPDLKLPHLEAERLLLGIYTDDLLAPLPRQKQLALRYILPLPLTWCTNDYV